jgi:hypothetical protein
VNRHAVTQGCTMTVDSLVPICGDNARIYERNL